LFALSDGRNELFSILQTNRAVLVVSSAVIGVLCLLNLRYFVIWNQSSISESKLTSMLTMSLYQRHDQQQQQNPTARLRYATLDCVDKFGGPPIEIAQEMVYWKEIPSDAVLYTSPRKLQDELLGKDVPRQGKYLVCSIRFCRSIRLFSRISKLEQSLHLISSVLTCFLLCFRFVDL
jgi:hypothetical protein